MSEFGPTYPKINTLWKRGGPKNHIIPGDYARPEFEYLAYTMPFVWTEKLDGTNTRLYWNGQVVRIGGRTDNAQWNPRVYEALQAIANPLAFEHVYGKKHVVLYGETFGAGIQKGGGYGPDVMFRPFDVRFGTEDGISQNSPFAGRAKIIEISRALDVEPVSILSLDTIDYAWGKMVNGRYDSTYPGHELEGIVGRPEVPLYVANHESLTPLMVKMKYRDIEELV